MTIDKWKTQLRKGAAELVVLALLGRRPSSGVALLKRVEAFPAIGLSGGALYPLLNRLEREGKIAGDWQPREVGRPEKAYSLTEAGQTWLAAMQAERGQFDAALKQILEGDA